MRSVSLVAGLFYLALLSGCGGDSRPAKGDGPTFLVASFSTLTELQSDGTRRVVANAGAGNFVRYPAISMDGAMVAYSRQAAAQAGANGVVDFGADIYVVPRGGGQPREVVHHSKPGEFLGSPIWLPDGNSLLYSSRGVDAAGQPDLYVGRVDLKTGLTSRVLADAAEPSISADGKELVFITVQNDINGGEIAISNVDGSNFRMLVPGSAGKFGILSPVFSPDGQRIAFASMEKEALGQPSGVSTSNAHPSTHDIWIVNRDGSGLAVFADIAEISPCLTWAGDGRWLYMLGPAGIWQVDASGKNVEQIGPGLSNSQLIWVPNTRN